MKKDTGVYMIVNCIDDMVYVGGSTNLEDRWKNHFIYLRLGRHENGNLQEAYNKMGEEVFSIQVLDYCSKDILKNVEQYWLDNLPNLYNIVPNAKGGRKPGPLTEEWKRKIGESSRGNKGNSRAERTEQWRRRLSEAGKRRWATVRGEK